MRNWLSTASTYFYVALDESQYLNGGDIDVGTDRRKVGVAFLDRHLWDVAHRG